MPSNNLMYSKSITWLVLQIVNYIKQLLQKRVFRLLTRSHPNFDNAKSRTLNTKSFRSLKAAFAKIKHTKSRKKVMIGTTPNLSTEISTLITKKESFETTTLAARRLIPTNEGSKLFCRYCKKNKHTIHDCWKLHGKPGEEKPLRPNSSWRSSSRQHFNGNGKTNIVQGHAEGTFHHNDNSSLPTKNQIEALLQLLNEHQPINTQILIQTTMANT